MCYFIVWTCLLLVCYLNVSTVCRSVMLPYYFEWQNNSFIKVIVIALPRGSWEGYTTVATFESY